MTLEFKFINGMAWDFVEDVPNACQVEVAGNDNRFLSVDGMMGSADYHVCYQSCAACDMKTVRFRVDMTNEEVSPFGVHVAGDFQGWDPAGTELTDPDGDMVYESIQSMPDSVEQIVFKFINGSDWTDPNELVDAACGDETGNRVLVLDSSAGNNVVLSADEIGSPYCFNSCSSCVLPLAVTFTVDMTVVASVSENGVHIAGSFKDGTHRVQHSPTTATARGASPQRWPQAPMSSSSSTAMRGMATKKTWKAQVATMVATASRPSMPTTTPTPHASTRAQESHVWLIQTLQMSRSVSTWPTKT